jgi:integrative and conjugative element protein (TIGR02256 family)
MGWLFARQDVGTLFFTAHVVQSLIAHRQHGRESREAGGVLLGRHLLDCDDLIVDEITQPSKGDRRSWASFFRSLAHQTWALNRWRQSAGACAYLGSWHTHPQPDPKPSDTDWADWRHALARDRYEGDHLFFLIVGIDRARVWEGNRHGSFTEIPLTQEL